MLSRLFQSFILAVQVIFSAALLLGVTFGPILFLFICFLFLKWLVRRSGGLVWRTLLYGSMAAIIVHAAFLIFLLTSIFTSHDAQAGFALGLVLLVGFPLSIIVWVVVSVISALILRK